MTISQILSDISAYSEENLNKKEFIPGSSVLPASGPMMYPEDIVAIVRSALSFWYTDFKHCHQFREKLSKFTTQPYIELCNSGSSASLAAVTAVVEYYKHHGIYIITCATGFPTTVAPIYQAGKVPYFVDINPKTLAPNYDQIDYITEKNKTFDREVCGAVFTHTMGFPFNEIRVREALEMNQFFVADCCDALGAKAYDEPVGVMADICTASFFPAHHIFSGEGGAVLTYDQKLYDIARSLINWGRSCYCAPGQSNTCGKRFEWEERGKLPDGWDHKYIFDRLGYNLKMTEFQAALGASQMDHIEDFVQARKYNYGYLLSGLLEFGEFLQFVEVPEWSEPSQFGFPVAVKEGAPFTAAELIAHLENNNIQTRRMFGGNLTKQPAFQKQPYACAPDLSGSDFVMNNMFWVGCHPALSHKMLEYMWEIFSEFFEDI